MDEKLKKLNKAIEQYVSDEIETETIPLFKKLGIEKVPEGYKQKRIDNIREQLFESDKWVREIMTR